MRRPRFRQLAALAATALAVAVPAATASAAVIPAAPSAPVLTLNALGGPQANPGDLLSATLLPDPPLSLLEATSGLGLTCKASTWQGQLLSNPALPGPAVIRLLAYTISLCSDNNPGVTGVASVVVSGLPDNLTVNGGTFVLQIVPASSSPLTITAVVNVGSGTATCVYQAVPATNGITALGSTLWKFTNQPFTLVAGPLGPCGVTVKDNFTAVYYPITDSTAGGATVYVN
jgi:hypothetical protein